MGSLEVGRQAYSFGYFGCRAEDDKENRQHVWHGLQKQVGMLCTSGSPSLMTPALQESAQTCAICVCDLKLVFTPCRDRALKEPVRSWLHLQKRCIPYGNKIAVCILARWTGA